MGRMTTGVFFGVEVPKGVHLDEEADRKKGKGLLDKWEAFSVGKLRQSPIVEACAGSKRLIGAWVAVPDGEHECAGACDIDGLTITTEGLLELPQANKAACAWGAFAKWAHANHGADFVEPEMWITSLEVG